MVPCRTITLIILLINIHRTEGQEKNVKTVANSNFKYSKFFQFKFSKEVKVGISLGEKNKITDIAMKQSNTLGLKKHLQIYHKTTRESLFDLFVWSRQKISQDP